MWQLFFFDARVVLKSARRVWTLPPSFFGPRSWFPDFPFLTDGFLPFWALLLPLGCPAVNLEP